MIDRELLDDVHFAVLANGANWHADFSPDEINAVSAHWHSMEKLTPAKQWWGLDVYHPAVGRALRIDRTQDGGAYALLPFRFCRYDGKPLILAAYPCPPLLSVDADWLQISAVIAWDPVSDTAHVLDGDGPQLVGRLTDFSNEIHGSPRAFFQAWAIRRAAFAVQWQTAKSRRWDAVPTEREEVPGALVIGDISKIPLAPSLMPTHLECVEIDPKIVNRAIMRAARLPRATGADMRRAA